METNNKIGNNDNNIKQDEAKKKLQAHPFEIDQDVKMIDLKPIEKKRLAIVYDALIQLELEASSDEESLTKKYLKEVEEKANQKKMNAKMFKNDDYKKKPKKDMNKTDYSNEEKEEKKKPEVKIGKKALRKMLRLYTDQKNYSAEDIDQMIWEVDEDMDERVSMYEMEKMYKRCIVDKQELEPKKLFYFILFLMFDKENKRSITEEDTLELLRVRHTTDQEFNDAIAEIFNSDLKKKTARAENEEEHLHFNDFVKIMTNLVLNKRDIVKEKKENYCKHIKDNKNIK